MQNIVLLEIFTLYNDNFGFQGVKHEIEVVLACEVKKKSDLRENWKEEFVGRERNETTMGGESKFVLCVYEV